MIQAPKIRVLIADDEPLARRGISNLLATCDDVEIVGEARHGFEAVRMIQTLKPDVIFLDIQMPELDGFQVLKQVGPSLTSEVIFVTAFDTFAVQAFEENALDYLVKPTTEARFRKAFARVRERIHARLHSASAPVVKHATHRIVIRSNDSDLLLDPQEIDWIEADDYYAAIHARGHKHLLRESLSSLHARLNTTTFVRVHRAAIVNLSAVQELRHDREGRSFLILNDGTQLPLSRRRRATMHAALLRFSAHAADRQYRLATAPLPLTD